MITQIIESYVAIRNNVCSVINTCPPNALMFQAMVRKPLVLAVQVRICLLPSPTYPVALFSFEDEKTSKDETLSFPLPISLGQILSGFL